MPLDDLGLGEHRFRVIDFEKFEGLAIGSLQSEEHRVETCSKIHNLFLDIAGSALHEIAHHVIDRSHSTPVASVDQGGSPFHCLWRHEVLKKGVFIVAQPSGRQLRDCGVVICTSHTCGRRHLKKIDSG